MGARVHKLAGVETTPELMLDMIKANIDDMESIVVSVIGGNGQGTFWTKMKSSEMAWHLYGIQADLLEDLRERDEI